MLHNKLLRLYQDIEEMEQTKEVQSIRRKIEIILKDELRQNVLETVSIAEVVGYDEIESYLKHALELVQMYKKQ